MNREFWWGLDPVQWVEENFTDPFNSGKKIRLDDWQKELLSGKDPRVLCLASRQSGKSECISFICVHTAIYQSPSLCLIISASQRQASELFKKCRDRLLSLKDHGKLVHETTTMLELGNGSRIVALPANEVTLRGYSRPAILIFEEGCWCPDDVYNAARPMLAANPSGRLIGISSAGAKQGWFFESYTSGSPVWKRFEVPATACPRITPLFLEQERQTLPHQVFEGEYFCQFQDNIEMIFGFEDVERLFVPDAEILTIPRFRGEKPCMKASII